MSPDGGTIGWDIGGAHLKAAAIDREDRLCWVKQLPVPLWRGPDHLDAALADVVRDVEPARFAHAVTMTGELADCFDDREQGVAQLLVRFVKCMPGHECRVYAGRRGFVDPRRAHTALADIASANWYATAEWLASVRPSGILVDIGSTTTDVVAFDAGKVCNRGYSDRERLAVDELVYTGIVRTPVMAVVETLPFAGDWTALANEHFATTADVYRIAGLLPDGADQYPSADGGDKSVTASMRRLARIIGADLNDGTEGDWRQAAAFVADRQLNAIASAVWRQASRFGDKRLPLIAAGVGKHLVKRVASRVNTCAVDIDDLLGTVESGSVSAGQCAPAVAVARLRRRETMVCAC